MLTMLAYVSRPEIRAHSAEMLDVARVSLRRNSRASVTGVLYFSDLRFFQMLEGPAKAVDDTYARIEQDDRHSDVTLLHRGRADFRRFAGWAMQFRDGHDLPHLRRLFDHVPLRPMEIGAIEERIDALMAH